MTHYDSLGMGEKRGGISATLFPIHELLKDHDYRSNGYVLHTDNWYTSLDSCHLCLEREIDCIGTVKINRKALPKNGIFPKKGKNKPIKGQGKVHEEGCGGDLLHCLDGQQTRPYAFNDSTQPY